MMRSLSTSALGQPSETKLTFGARAAPVSVSILAVSFAMGEGLPEPAARGKAAVFLRRSPPAFAAACNRQLARPFGGPLEGWPSGLRQRGREARQGLQTIC